MYPNELTTFAQNSFADISQVRFGCEIARMVCLHSVPAQLLISGDDKMLDKTSLILVIIGALNWGSVGLFKFVFVGWLFGGQAATFSRIIFTLVGLAGLWCISLLFRDTEETSSEISRM